MVVLIRLLLKGSRKKMPFGKALWMIVSLSNDRLYFTRYESRIFDRLYFTRYESRIFGWYRLSRREGLFGPDASKNLTPHDNIAVMRV